MSKLVPFLAQTLFILVSLILFSCSARPEEKSLSLSQFKGRKTTVRVVQALNGHLSYGIEGTGKVRAINEVDVISVMQGKITRCSIRNGSRCRKNQPLVVFDTTELRLRAVRARENYFNALVNFKSELMAYNRKQSNLPDTLTHKLKISTGLALAEVDLADAELALQKAVVRAPFDGIVSNLNVQAGSYATIGERLFIIYSDQELFVVTRVMESEVGMIKVGQRAEVTTLANKTKYQSIVSEINPYIDSKGFAEVSLRLLDTKGIMAGMNVRASINSTTQTSILVPKEAIVIHDEKFVVFTYDNGHAKWNFVTTGLDNGHEIEVITGLNPGDKVIVSNNFLLNHDSPVEIEL